VTAADHPVGHRLIAAAELGHAQLYWLLTSLVVPRPIAWVSTVSAGGVRNLAPHSYFSIASTDPPVLSISSNARDTLRNVTETGEFVANIAGADSALALDRTSAPLPPEVDEFEWAGVEAAPSFAVAPPRVADARAALECRVVGTVPVGDSILVLGEVLHAHVAEDVVANGHLDTLCLGALSVLEGHRYVVVSESMEREIDRLDARLR